MFKHKYKLRFIGNAEKVEQMYQQREKELKQLKKLQKRTKREKAIVAIMAILGMIGLMGLATYLIILIPLPENPFAKLISWVIYIFVIIPIFGWGIILFNKHIYRDYSGMQEMAVKTTKYINCLTNRSSGWPAATADLSC